MGFTPEGGPVLRAWHQGWLTSRVLLRKIRHRLRRRRARDDRECLKESMRRRRHSSRALPRRRRVETPPGNLQRLFIILSTTARGFGIALREADGERHAGARFRPRRCRRSHVLAAPKSDPDRLAEPSSPFRLDCLPCARVDKVLRSAFQAQRRASVSSDNRHPLDTQGLCWCTSGHHRRYGLHRFRRWRGTSSHSVLKVLLIDSDDPRIWRQSYQNLYGIRDQGVVDNSDIRNPVNPYRVFSTGQDFLFNLAAQTGHLDSMTAPEGTISH